VADLVTSRRRTTIDVHPDRDDFFGENTRRLPVTLSGAFQRHHRRRHATVTITDNDTPRGSTCPTRPR
jgi:hypothetical protein